MLLMHVCYIDFSLVSELACMFFIEGVHTPQAGRLVISERSWANVRPAKRAAVRMKRCIVILLCVMIYFDGDVGRCLARCDN